MTAICSGQEETVAEGVRAEAPVTEQALELSLGSGQCAAVGVVPLKAAQHPPLYDGSLTYANNLFWGGIGVTHCKLYCDSG